MKLPPRMCSTKGLERLAGTALIKYGILCACKYASELCAQSWFTYRAPHGDGQSGHTHKARTEAEARERESPSRISRAKCSSSVRLEACSGSRDPEVQSHKLLNMIAFPLVWYKADLGLEKLCGFLRSMLVKTEGINCPTHSDP